MNLFKIFVTSLLLLAVSTFSIAESGDSKEDIEAVSKVLDKYGQFLLADDIRSWADLHADNVVKMPPNAPAITSQKVLYEGRLKKAAKVKVVNWNHEIKEIEIMGNRAYTWGIYQVDLKVVETGGMVNVDGKFLTIYKKEPDGRWVITHDCFNSNIPPKK